MPRIAILAVLCTLALTARAEPWRDLGDGLELARFPLPQRSSHADSTLTVVRVDPKKAQFVLLSAWQRKERPHTARQWAEQHKLRAVINAGMFTPERRPVGFMRVGDVPVNGKLGKDRSLFAFSPKVAALPTAHLLDRTCDGDEPIAQYGSLFQGIRMIDCEAKVVWGLQEKKWSIAALAEDAQGRVLMLHSRSPYPVHTFAKMLLQLPLDVRRAMYLEGGPEATLFVRAGGVEREDVGSYETSFFEDDSNVDAWALPNVLAVTAR